MSASTLLPALETALIRHGLGTGRVEHLHPLTGGATKESWAFDWIGDWGCQGLVFQRPRSTATPAPVEGVPKLTPEQDAALMRAARQAGVQAPVVRCVLPPENELGRGVVTERVDGEVLGRKVVHDLKWSAARAKLTMQCAQALAALHSIPLQATPFLKTLSAEQELQTYTPLLEGLENDHPALAYTVRWLRTHLPNEEHTSVVHADFRTGNLIVGPDGLRCVLDWEIARAGDPFQDFGVLCMRSWRFGGSGPVGGFGSRDDLYTAYERASGISVDPQRVQFWEGMANFKWAVSCVRRGRATGIDMRAIGRRLEEPLWDFLELIHSGGD